jgi:hypothetical protein
MAVENLGGEGCQYYFHNNGTVSTVANREEAISHEKSGMDTGVVCLESHGTYALEGQFDGKPNNPDAFLNRHALEAVLGEALRERQGTAGWPQGRYGFESRSSGHLSIYKK